MRIYFLSEFSVCCHPKILLPWQRDLTTSLLYCFSSASLILGLILGRTRSHIPTVVQGGGGGWSVDGTPLSF